MIRFFRQIRHQLLAQTRFNRYLLSAIGEVFLVVVRIRIALQIDPRNQERKDCRAEPEIVENLVDDSPYRLLRYENNLKKIKALMQKILRSIEKDLQSNRPFPPIRSLTNDCI